MSVKHIRIGISIFAKKSTDLFRNLFSSIFRCILFCRNPKLWILVRGGIGLVLNFRKEDANHIHSQIRVGILHTPTIKTIVTERKNATNITRFF